MSKLYLGDSLVILKELEPNSIDAIVTDPPYGFEFMGKEWDKGVPGIHFWQEMLRVLKPGGHLLSFGGSRTYHRMACAIEDAGFEIRDQIMWVYGSGIPKSLNVKKKIEGDYKCQFIENAKSVVKKSRLTPVELNGERIGFVAVNVATQQGEEKENLTVIGRVGDSPEAMGTCQLESTEEIDLNTMLSLKKRLEDLLKNGNNAITLTELETTIDLRIWKLFRYPNTLKSIETLNHTALKPAHEPIVLARKPLSEKTVAENCLKWGVGGLAIDECRVGDFKPTQGSAQIYQSNSYKGIRKEYPIPNHTGRFPANFITDGSDEVVDLFPNVKSTGGTKPVGGNYKLSQNRTQQPYFNYSDSGSAARFFYVAKSSKRERNCNGKVNNIHPTCKPVTLMKYLIKLVSREGQTILDPFLGSGTTGIAAKELKREFIGIEKSEEYYKIAEARIGK